MSFFDGMFKCNKCNDFDDICDNVFIRYIKYSFITNYYMKSYGKVFIANKLFCRPLGKIELWLNILVLEIIEYDYVR